MRFIALIFFAIVITVSFTLYLKHIFDKDSIDDDIC